MANSLFAEDCVELKQADTRIRHYMVRSQLEAKMNLLRETKHAHALPTIIEIASNLLF